MSSEGLMLVTNDGELANRLAHPRYQISKTYQVEVAGHLPSQMMQRLRKGIRLAEAVVRMSEARIKRRHKHSTTLEVVLREGRNREIRRMLARLGHKVLRLKRVALGPLRLGTLAPGAYRSLESREVRALRSATSGRGTARARRPRGRQRRSSATAAAADSPTVEHRAAAGERRPAAHRGKTGSRSTAGRPKAATSSRRKSNRRQGRR
jgi:23S rRNA pseudouridine2605 synthase